MEIDSLLWKRTIKIDLVKKFIQFYCVNKVIAAPHNHWKYIIVFARRQEKNWLEITGIM